MLWVLCAGDDRTRRSSGDGGRRRHFSGESIKKLFHLGKSNRSQSTSSEQDGDVSGGKADAGNIQEEEETAAKLDEDVTASTAQPQEPLDDVALRLRDVSIELSK